MAATSAPSVLEPFANSLSKRASKNPTLRLIKVGTRLPECRKLPDNALDRAAIARRHGLFGVAPNEFDWAMKLAQKFV